MKRRPDGAKADSWRVFLRIRVRLMKSLAGAGGVEPPIS